MLLVDADHWQQLEQLVELDHAPAAPAAAGWMGPATVSGLAAVCVESITRREAASHGTARRCRHAMTQRLEPRGGLWEQRGQPDGHGWGIDEYSRKNVTNYEILHHTRVVHQPGGFSLS